MSLVTHSFLVCLWSFFLHAFCFVSKKPLSILGKNSTEMESDFEGVLENDDDGNGDYKNEEMGFNLVEEKEVLKLCPKVENVSNLVTSMYQFTSDSTVCGFIEEPQTVRYTVQEMFAVSDHESRGGDDLAAITDSSVDDLSGGEVGVDSHSSEYEDCGEVDDEMVANQEKTECSVSELDMKERVVSMEELLDEARRSSVSDTNEFWASIHDLDEYSVSDDVLDSDSDEMLGRFNAEVKKEDIDFRYIEIEPQTGKFRVHSEEIMSGNEFSESEDEFEEESRGYDDMKGVGEEEEDEQSEVDVLLEQKELIRQMKKEMRRLKMGGLPTILEEFESPRVEDDLRPLKIDERIGHKDFMGEIQTLYKKYLDKMKRLDILSQQTMYGIALLELKSQEQLSTDKKVSAPVIKSIWSSYKLERKHEVAPVEKVIRDFRKDLELAYVSQLCLSWEILKWQHHKSQELHAVDPHGFRQHNQVAGEFQKFQVLLQRFTEDEPFYPGPRIQHYVNSRSIFPNLLQVPLIKDDPGGEWRGKGEGGISIGMLKEVIGSSMRAFWGFLHADKDEYHEFTLTGIHGIDIDLQHSSDSDLLLDLRSKLHKKERRLKDLLRSGNCLVRKFQKHQNQRLNHDIFLAQVELRLVSRVLNMSRLTTDQLLWCHKKLSKINIVGRKIYLDSSFLLFP